MSEPEREQFEAQRRVQSFFAVFSCGGGEFEVSGANFFAKEESFRAFGTLSQAKSTIGIKHAGARVHFLRTAPHLHPRAQCRAPRRANLHLRWRHGHAVLYSQTRPSINRSLGDSDATDMVPEKRRAAHAIITHCGSEIMTGDERKISACDPPDG